MSRYERAMMALAEAGYPDAEIVYGTLHGHRSALFPHVPQPVQYQAVRLAYEAEGIRYSTCYACSQVLRLCEPDDHADDCDGYGWGVDHVAEEQAA